MYPVSHLKNQIYEDITHISQSELFKIYHLMPLLSSELAKHFCINFRISQHQKVTMCSDTLVLGIYSKDTKSATIIVYCSRSGESWENGADTWGRIKSHVISSFILSVRKFILWGLRGTIRGNYKITSTRRTWWASSMKPKHVLHKDINKLCWPIVMNNMN